ncbi:Uncharacterised protein [Yersinia frederiksenii]|uniref:DUF4393 domain-containing protein n=2 Tax=Yersinia frederiksenii TaxID=29484 RepID=A0A380PNP7_YERFR|nr:DUF4393 domain-containing protein [Yersinia frederiksenii]ATM96139.1 DUF4393 domain-containing protein [Yersinia frederiksenii]EEQ16384.1 hypothetical protein yfred0001_4360 [Yersinia frederiksenii ATCC 33641]KGA44314.1 hypothetical protein DJ58_2761 [Yersinia frederiksenii ATCC 33641]SUP75180.1 Uncharacterised protein [Yersinia frederiksenii]
MSEENKIRDAADAVAGIVKAVPVYQDVLQPAAQEVGTALQTVAKTIHIVLAPVSAMVWGYDKIKDFISIKVAEKLKDVPPENLISPKPNVAGPALDALKYIGHDESLSDLYANLLASSMNKDTANYTHPSFVDIIKQLTSDEAKLLRYISVNSILPIIDVKLRTDTGGIMIYRRNFSLLGVNSEVEVTENTSSYIDNICRLGLCAIPIMSEYVDSSHYYDIEDLPEIKFLNNSDSGDVPRLKIERKALTITDFGVNFLNTCVSPSVQ